MYDNMSICCHYFFFVFVWLNLNILFSGV
uniref:Uncharacterized protein n=1 Tax=Rhizophora mucronata TaxID=61149 RepID=A0A2P2N5G4_RHIMU